MIRFSCYILICTSRISWHHLWPLWAKYWYLDIVKHSTCGSTRDSTRWCVQHINECPLRHPQCQFTDSMSAWMNSNGSRLSPPSHFSRKADLTRHDPVIFNAGFATLSLFSWLAQLIVFSLFFWLSLVPQENCTKFRHHCRIAETCEDDFIHKVDWLYSGMDNVGIRFHIVLGCDSGRQMKNPCYGNPFINNSFQIWSGSGNGIIWLFLGTVLMVKIQNVCFI